MGTPDFAVVSLEKLLLSGHDVAAVVTAPDKPMGRGRKTGISAVKKFTLDNHLPLVQPESLRDPAFIAQLMEYQADVFVVVAFRILPREVFAIPEHGTINLHASLLPKYRGAAPINWAIIHGEKESGVTTIRIDDKVDTGDMLLQATTPVPADMTAGELHDRLAVLGAELLVETLKGIEEEQMQPLRQQDAQASKAPKLTRELCLLDFNRPAMEVHNKIRGLSPYPGAYCVFRGQQLKILRTSCSDSVSTPDNLPGSVRAVRKDSFDINCSEGMITVHEVQPEGKRKMTAASFINGSHLQNGEQFE